MREILFRAWHKELKVMFDIEILSLDKNQSSSGSIVIDKDLQEMICDVNENLKLVQFTGLLDCNDKKIYDGNILKYDDSQIGGKPGIGIVEWWDDLTLVNAPGWYVWEIGAGLLNRSFPFQREIIGNIHQNKELLE